MTTQTTAEETSAEQPSPKKQRPTRSKSAFRTPVVSSRRLLDINDLVDLMRCNERTIEKMIDAGEFPPAMDLREDKAALGRDRRWTLEQYERWATRRQKKAEEAVQ